MTCEMSNSFSWRRAAMMWDYYSPVLKMQLWLWPLIAFGLYALGLLTSLSPFPMISSFSMSGLSWLIGLAPLMLVRSNALIADTMLPARYDEKFVFFSIYFFFIVPLLVAATVAVLYGLSVACLGAERLVEYSTILSMRAKTVTLTYGLGYFSEILGVTATLFGVTAFTRNRALAGVGMNVGTGVALGIIGAILGIIMAFTTGFVDAMRDLDGRYPNGIDDATGQQISSVMTDIYTVPMVQMIVTITAVVTFIGSMIFGYLTYRALRERQL